MFSSSRNGRKVSPLSLGQGDRLGVIYVVVVTCALSLAGCDRSEQPAVSEPYETFTAESMATTIAVILPARPGRAEAAEAVFNVFRDVDARMSEWKSTSPLAEVNHQAGRPVKVPEDLRGVVQRGVAIGKLTDGAFDITWAALWGLWDFKAPNPHPPSAADVADRVARVDFRDVTIDNEAGTVGLARPKMVLGLGGIAKGYALDLAAAELRRRGFESFSITAGGQVMVGGHKGARPWRVGIRDPRGDRQNFFAVVTASDLSVSTSGDYERFFIYEGVRYHHILDPRTGRPARGLRSVTVLSSDATLADALSTAIMVMGADKGLAMADATKGVEALVVDDHGEVRMTAGAKARVKILRQPIR